MDILEELSSMGSLVDSLLRRYLLRGSSREFSEVLLHQVEAGGKRLRPALTLLVCEAAGGRRDDAMNVAVAMELVHTYSLIFDDIIDRGELRRGKPTTRKKYGDPMALLAALHYREVISEVVNDGASPARLHGLVSGMIKNLVEGERIDVLYEQAGRQDAYIKRVRKTEPNWSTYERIVSLKTASLMRACAEAGAIAAGAPDEIVRAVGDYAGRAGEAFQIVDDVLDVFGEQTKLGKQIGKDIAEHKLGNAVVLLALDELKGSKRRALLSILRKERVTRKDISRAIELMKETKCKERALALARQKVVSAKEALKPLPDTNAKKRLEELADSFVTREF